LGGYPCLTSRSGTHAGRVLERMGLELGGVRGHEEMFGAWNL